MIRVFKYQVFLQRFVAHPSRWATVGGRMSAHTGGRTASALTPARRAGSGVPGGRRLLCPRGNWYRHPTPLPPTPAPTALPLSLPRACVSASLRHGALSAEQHTVRARRPSGARAQPEERGARSGARCALAGASGAAAQKAAARKASRARVQDAGAGSGGGDASGGGPVRSIGMPCRIFLRRRLPQLCGCRLRGWRRAARRKRQLAALLHAAELLLRGARWAAARPVTRPGVDTVAPRAGLLCGVPRLAAPRLRGVAAAARGGGAPRSCGCAGGGAPPLFASSQAKLFFANSRTCRNFIYYQAISPSLSFADTNNDLFCGKWKPSFRNGFYRRSWLQKPFMVRCLKRYVLKRRTCRERKDQLPLLRQRQYSDSGSQKPAG